MVGFAILMIVLLSIFTFWSGQPAHETNNWGYSVLLTEIQQSHVKELHIRGQRIEGKTFSGERFVTNGPRDHELLVKALQDQKANQKDLEYTFETEEGN